MAQENPEEAVRDLIDAFNRGDIPAALSRMDPAIEWWPAADEPATDPYRGHHGVLRALAELTEITPDLKSEVEGLIVVGDRAVASVRYWGSGVQSGVPVEIRETQVHRVRNGRVVEVREFRTKAEALEAVGRSE